MGEESGEEDVHEGCQSGVKQMWNWIARLLKSSHESPDGASGEILVNDEDYEFKVGTKPTLPEGLRDLKITLLSHDLLFLEHFNAELTVNQTAWDRTVKDIAASTRIYRWATSYHDLAPINHVPVRLHGDNLLLSDSHFSDAHGPQADLSAWLERFGWTEACPFNVHRAETEKPLEDGFFSCLRITIGRASDSSDSLLSWKAISSHSPSICGVLEEFIRQELAQPWGAECEQYLRQCYKTVPSESMTHPVFALIDFPVFDMGMLRMSFAGSVVSDQELRFWSRPTYYHK